MLPPWPPTRKLTPIQVLERLQRRVEKRMESLQRVKLDGFEPVIRELETELDFCVGRPGILRNDLRKWGGAMTKEEAKMFTTLLFDHKHLWIAFQETRRLREFPEEDPFEVHSRFCDAADEIYQPLSDALLSGQPIQDILETVLLASRIAQSEGKVF